MNIHTAYTVISIAGFLVFSLSFVTISVSPNMGHSHITRAVCYGALALAGLLSLVYGVFHEDSPWPDPATANASASQTVRIANHLGPPRTISQMRATIATANSAVQERTQQATINIHYVSRGSFTVTLSGDSARTCITYHPRTYHWTWAPGRCRPGPNIR
jgi:hypothetical protein